MDKKILIILAAILLVVTAAGAATIKIQKTNQSKNVVITMPYSPYIRNLDNNYYKQWLEQKTGLSITFNIIPESYTADYLDLMFTSGYINTDAFFSFYTGKSPAVTNSVLQKYGQDGLIIPLNDYIDKSVYLKNVFEEFKEYDLKKAMTSSDGNIYYMPGLDISIDKRNSQVLWLNKNWLKKLDMKIPKTTDELRDVLEGFKSIQRDDGLISIPLAGSKDLPSQQSYNFIINAFVYNSPDSLRMYLENGVVMFAPTTDEWRSAMQYLNKLYKDGLLDPFQFSLSQSGLSALANDPRDLLGGFTCRSIMDVLLQSSPEIIGSFVHVPPIAGPNGVQFSAINIPLPKPNGIITSSCKYPEDVFKLFDLMLSKEAFIIGRYGEENVDWQFAKDTDTDMYSRKATIKITNQLSNKMQNKHLVEMGPFFSYPEYADGATWSGFEADQQYIDARGFRAYEAYKPDEFISAIIFEGKDAEELDALRISIEAYTNKHLEAFIKGDADPFDDDVWKEYLNGYDILGLDRLVMAVQKSYTQSRKD